MTWSRQIATVLLWVAGAALIAPALGFPGFPPARSGSPQARSDSPEARLSEAEWGSYHEREPEGPGTYAFGYDVEDPETGNTQFRQEQRHVDGSVTGSYGSVQPDGNVQVVHYTADHLGYRVRIENSIRKDEDIPARPEEHSPEFVSALASQQAPQSTIHEQHVRPISQGHHSAPVTSQGVRLLPITSQGVHSKPITSQGHHLQPTTNQGHHSEPVTSQGNPLQHINSQENSLRQGQVHPLRQNQNVYSQGNGLRDVRPITSEENELLQGQAGKQGIYQGNAALPFEPIGSQGNDLLQGVPTDRRNDDGRTQYQLANRVVSKVRKVYPVSERDLRRQFSRPSDWQKSFRYV